MREIKFRGKRVDNSKWIYGYYLPWHAVTDLIGNEPYAQIFEEYKKNGKYIAKGWAKVLFNSVSEYTGLTDKNGVEIYEGDIVCTRFPEECENAGRICHIGDIQFRDGMFGIEWTQWKNDTFWGLRRLDEDFHKEIEVIGNIYDNPELLKGDKE